MIETRDRDWLDAVLRRDAVWGGYALGDLDDAEFARTRWFASDAEGRGLVLRYEAFGNTTLMMFGEGRQIAGLLDRLPLPARFHVHFRTDQADALAPRLAGELGAYLRLAVRRDRLRDVPPVDGLVIRALAPSDLASVDRLYASYPENWFAPSRLGTGHYRGAFLGIDGRLVAVGGTHVASDERGVAALGDIVTDPTLRGRGLGAALTRSLCEALLARVELVVLNVLESNAAGRRCYEKVGFGDPVAHFEGFDIALRPG